MTQTGLDCSQRTVVALPAEGRQIVLAGPGAGKTEAVSRLADRLVRDGVYPDEILIISFSRAALVATAQRTQHIVEEGQGIDLTTIDALAARIMLAAEDDYELRGFDDTVSRATALLTEVGWELGSVSHVIVDEVQDVVGLRARFVLELLKVLVDRGAGFTLLGDPLQAVYDFQLGRDTMTSDRLLAEVRSAFSPEERTLTGEHRTRSEHARAAATARAALASMEPEERLRILGAISVDLPPLGLVDADALHDVAAWSGTTALLTDTNIRAALLAQKAAELGFAVAIVPSRDDAILPAWIARILQDYPESSLSRQEFLDLGCDEHEGWPDRWRTLLQLSRCRRDLQLGELGFALHSPSRWHLLDGSCTGPMRASTVHRAKGLEFDNVVLIDPDGWASRDDEPADTASRRLFVALTRARIRISRMRGVDTRGWSRPKVKGTPVWVKRQPRRGGQGRVIAMLVEPWMVRALGPTSRHLDAVVGASVTWQRGDEHISVDGDPVPSWTAYADDIPVARTGEHFGHIAAALTDRKLLRLPDLVGGYVEGLETVAGPLTGLAGPGQHGFWTGARVIGAVRFVWN